MAGKYVTYLDAATLEKSRRELNEDPNERDGQLQKLRELVENHPYIKCRTDDSFLIRFLRRCRCSPNAASIMISKFCMIRASEKHGVPRWFYGVSPYTDDIMEIMDLCACVPMPIRDKNGEKILIIRTGAWDPKKPEHFENMMRYSFLMMDSVLRDEATQVHGLTMVIDFEEFSRHHATYYTHDIIRDNMRCYQDVYPSRNKSIHYYKTPKVFNALFEIVKIFMAKKLQERINFHSSKESLCKKVNKDALPMEYGGNAGPLKDINQHWKEELSQQKEEWELMKLIEVDDSKIPPGKNPMDMVADPTLIGTEGSYRKLNTD